MEDIYFDENVKKFVDILFEKQYVVLLSLVESLDSQENKNNADEVAQTLLDFLISNKRILPVLNLLISKEIDFVGKKNTLLQSTQLLFCVNYILKSNCKKIIQQHYSEETLYVVKYSQDSQK